MCKHAKDGFCCKCKYGELSHVDKTHTKPDVLQDMSVSSRRGIERHFNDYRAMKHNDEYDSRKW